MGKSLIKKLEQEPVITVTDSTSTKKDELYKPIADFSWKDASPAEIHQNSIDAYKKYAF